MVVQVWRNHGSLHAHHTVVQLQLSRMLSQDYIRSLESLDSHTNSQKDQQCFQNFRVS